MVIEVVSSQIYLAVVRNLDFIVRLLDGFEEGNDQIRFFFAGGRVKGSLWVLSG